MKNIMFYMGHPAHFHLFRHAIHRLYANGHRIQILIKTKDILETLVRDEGFEYKNILPEGRKDNKPSILLGMLKRDVQLYKECRRERPDLLVGTSVENSHISKLLSIPCINVNEDDAAAVPLYAKLSYPWATTILTPVSCDCGRWDHKAIKYQGYHELGYLHPNHFTPSREVVRQYFNPDERYFILRFAKLAAHHDAGVRGIESRVAHEILKILQPLGKVYITSERELEPELEQFRLNIKLLDIHHVLAFASFYIGDSQTMAAESAVLGTPFLRFNDFVGRLGYLAQLEDKYQLGYGIKPEESHRLLELTEKMANTPNLHEIYQERRRRMLEEKIDVAAFLTWFIEGYPESEEIMKENPAYQYKFR